MTPGTLVRGTFVALASTLVAGAALAGAADVFHGRVLFVPGHVPSRFGSEGAMISFIRSHSAERLNEDAQGKWNFEFMSFFAHPLNDVECTITFFDVED